MKTIEKSYIHDSGTNVEFKAVIGNYQPGSHIWAGGIKPDNMPTSNNVTWESSIHGAEGNTFKFDSYSWNKNPQTNWTSLKIWIDGNVLDTLTYEAEEDEAVEFLIKIEFK